MAGACSPAPPASGTGGPGGSAGSGFGFAHAQHTGPIHPTVLAMLACTCKIRRVLVDENGAVLDLGRSPPRNTRAEAALLARDVGCVIPGCTISGAFCEVHHATPWSDHGDTNIDNLRSAEAVARIQGEAGRRSAG